MKKILMIAVCSALASSLAFAEKLGLKADHAKRIPQNVKELWADFDPDAEPLDIEILNEKEIQGVVVRLVRYRAGIFNGHKTMVAAIYGFPKGGKNLPGLLQMHGGGQFADQNAILANAKRGYATLSVAWTGRYKSSLGRMDSSSLQVAWTNQPSATPNMGQTTDWGPFDAYHAPARYKNQNVFLSPTSEHTIDPVDSPRNSAWYLWTIAGRRGLTFLQRQPEVNPELLGVYGHSMGGRLTVMVSGCDPRVKAAAPSCGGVSFRKNRSAVVEKMLTDQQYLQGITCPIIFLNPANDFHGEFHDLQTALTEIKSKEYRVTAAPHHSHQDLPESEVVALLWFDQFLKGSFSFPKTPAARLLPLREGAFPVCEVLPDRPNQAKTVEVYYLREGSGDRSHTINRFWHYAKAVRKGNAWYATIPLSDCKRPLWVYANVRYGLEKPVSPAGYYYRISPTDRYLLSSKMINVAPADLAKAKVKTVPADTTVLEDFDAEWQKEWYDYSPLSTWGRTTHKLHDPAYLIPKGAKLSLTVRAKKPNRLVFLLDQYAAELKLAGGSEWQTFTLAEEDFKDVDGKSLPAWKCFNELRLCPMGDIRGPRGTNKVRRLGGRWNGAAPEFRILKVVK